MLMGANPATENTMKIPLDSIGTEFTTFVILCPFLMIEDALNKIIAVIQLQCYYI